MVVESHEMESEHVCQSIAAIGLDQAIRSGGLVLRAQEAVVSEDIVRLLPQLKYLQKYSYDDAATSVLTVCAEKPMRAPAINQASS